MDIRLFKGCGIPKILYSFKLGLRSWETWKPIGEENSLRIFPRKKVFEDLLGLRS